MTQITKGENHDHFFIEGDRLYESYMTGVGLKTKLLMHVNDISTNEKLNVEQMKNNNLGHLMVDIETLGTGSNSVICSIAAVEFDLVTGQTGRIFQRYISIQSCLDAGLSVDGSTIEWWMQQSNEARLLLSTGLTTIEVAIRDFWCFFQNLGAEDLKVWGNGSRFDLGIIADGFRAVAMLTPWKHSNERDVRTLVSFAPEIKNNMPFEGTKHTPKDDCLYQIKYCSAIFKKLKGIE